VSKPSGNNDEERVAKLEALVAAVERWLRDPRYVTEQMMIKALRDIRQARGR